MLTFGLLPFSHDASKIISGSSDKIIRIWNASTGVQTLPPLRGHGDCVRLVTFSHDGSGSAIRVWQTQALRYSGYVRSVSFSHDGSKIVLIR
jgi:WD40 repeat protein